jgi:hypothetical protein
MLVTISYGVLASLDVLFEVVRGVDVNHASLGAGVPVARACSLTCIYAMFEIFHGPGTGRREPAKKKALAWP